MHPWPTFHPKHPFPAQYQQATPIPHDGPPHGSRGRFPPPNPKPRAQSRLLAHPTIRANKIQRLLDRHDTLRAMRRLPLSPSHTKHTRNAPPRNPRCLNIPSPPQHPPPAPRHQRPRRIEATGSARGTPPTGTMALPSSLSTFLTLIRISDPYAYRFVTFPSPARF